VRQWLSYAAAGLGLTLLVALVATALVADLARPGLWFAAGLAYVLQLAAFALLLRVRDHPQLFLAGWAGGILLRFAAVGAAAFWLARTAAYPPAGTLLGLVGFMMLLVFLEPVFLRARRAAGDNEGAS